MNVISVLIVLFVVYHNEIAVALRSGVTDNLKTGNILTCSYFSHFDPDSYNELINLLIGVTTHGVSLNNAATLSSSDTEPVSELSLYMIHSQNTRHKLIMIFL